MVGVHLSSLLLPTWNYWPSILWSIIHSPLLFRWLWFRWLWSYWPSLEDLAFPLRYWAKEVSWAWCIILIGCCFNWIIRKLRSPWCSLTLVDFLQISHYPTRMTSPVLGRKWGLLSVYIRGITLSVLVGLFFLVPWLAVIYWLIACIKIRKPAPPSKFYSSTRSYRYSLLSVLGTSVTLHSVCMHYYGGGKDWLQIFNLLLLFRYCHAFIYC